MVRPNWGQCLGPIEIGGGYGVKRINAAAQPGRFLTLMMLFPPGIVGVAMSRRKYRKGDIQYKFIAIPTDVLGSQEYITLSASAKALLMDLCVQYTGGNNGRLTPSWTAMERRGWRSKGTLAKAKRELLETSFCIVTRKGKAPQTAEWIGFTWWKPNYHKTWEINPAKWPYLNFMTPDNARIDPNEGR